MYLVGIGFDELDDVCLIFQATCSEFQFDKPRQVDELQGVELGAVVAWVADRDGGLVSGNAGDATFWHQVDIDVRFLVE